MITLLSTLPLCLLSAASVQPIPLILDTDIGDDIDDTWALCFLLGCPEVDLELVVTASDDTPKKTRLLAKILESTKRTAIPIGTGVKTSDNPIHQEKWLGDYALDHYTGVVHQDGVNAMIDVIRKSENMIAILVIGPQTNLREALNRAPDIASKARIVSMAGSVHVGYDGNPEPCPEWNVFKDIPAARAVFAASWPIAMAPLDACGTLRLKGPQFDRTASSNNPRAKTVIENYRQWANFTQHPAGQSSILFDTTAACMTFDQSYWKMETVPLSIDDKGNTVPDPQGRPVQCALEWQNRSAFEELLVNRLTQEHNK